MKKIYGGGPIKVLILIPADEIEGYENIIKFISEQSPNLTVTLIDKIADEEIIHNIETTGNLYSLILRVIKNSQLVYTSFYFSEKILTDELGIDLHKKEDRLGDWYASKYELPLVGFGDGVPDFSHHITRLLTYFNGK